ncbi:MarR family transcriptional regulator [Agrobacterium tumefaciens]|uniref:MarR family transcriptional regulator n=1 Tax=Agrobacterium tumefaciens TaxID=358 RepID=UPI0015739227|nr:MarR family transcriptional regulator [Agrobacterium tumefaciens]
MMAFDSPFVGFSFAATALKEVLDCPIEGETASARMKQIGFLCLIHQLQIAGADTTFTNIMTLTGLQRTSIAEFVAPLVARKLLVESHVRNTIGRGKATKGPVANFRA